MGACVYNWLYVHMCIFVYMGGLCHFASGLAKCEAVLHGYGTSLLEGGGLYQVVTVHSHGAFIVLAHWETRPTAP